MKFFKRIFAFINMGNAEYKNEIDNLHSPGHAEKAPKPKPKKYGVDNEYILMRNGSYSSPKK